MRRGHRLRAAGDRPHGDLVLSINGNVVTYQPADRFWTFQFIEAGIFVALTAAALGAAIWLLHRRPA
jgi:hypothetical protein